MAKNKKNKDKDEIDNEDNSKAGVRMLNKNKPFNMVFVGRLKCFFQKNRVFDPVTCEEMSKERIAELEG